MINKFFKKPSNILKIFVFIFVFVSCFSLFTQTTYAQTETDASGAPVYSAGVTTAVYDTSVKVADIPDKTLSSTGSKPSGAVCDISALALITDTGTAIYCGFAKLYVNIITFIPNLIAAIVGILNDIVINLSIGYGAYSTFQDKTFTAWKIIRDFSNIIIILSLFVAAFSLILGGGNGDAPEALQKFGDPKKIVVNVVIVALFINFSFFFSRVIIDAGNVTARFLYNQIGVDGDIGNDGGLAINIVKQATNTKQISIAMLSQVQPQTLLSTDEAKTEIAGGDTITAYLAVAHLTLLFDVVLIYIFSIMLFLFMGRIVMLNLLTILSPLAFASYPIPFLRKQEFIGLDSWIKEIVGNSFLATIFLFFIYLSVLFSKIDITGGTGGAGLSGFATGFLLTVVGMLFKVALMFGVIFKGKTLALKMAGTMGQYVSQAAGWATGIAAGAATGGTALLARQTVGAVGSAAATSGWANRLASSNNGILSGIGKSVRSGGNRLGAASFDVRNSPSMMGRLNQATNAIGGGDLFDPKKGIMGNKFQREGGYTAEGSLKKQYGNYKKGVADRKIKEREERAKELEQLARERHQSDIDKAQEDERTAQQVANQEKTNQENSVHDFRANSAHMQAVQQRVDIEVAGLTTDEAKLTSAIQALEQEVNNLPQNTPEEKEIHRKKSQELTNMKDEHTLVTKAITTANQHKNDQVSVATQMQAKGYSSIDQMSENKKQLEERAGNSAEKAKLDKEKADLEKEKQKAKDLGNELKEATKQNNQAEMTRLNAELTAQNIKVNTAQQSVINAKTAFETAYENDIKALEKDIKDFTNKIKGSDYNKTRTQLTQHRSTTATQNLREVNTTAQQAVNQAQLNYAQELENRSNSGWKKMASVITNGKAFGGTTNNANQTAAQNIKNNINRKS